MTGTGSPAGIVAGHLIECGVQATGGNFTDWERVPGLGREGFPVVEVEEDGRFVLTKQPGSGGLVSPAVAREQLLYEMGDPECYLCPDATVDFSGLGVAVAGEDRVLVEGARGGPPPPDLKVSASVRGGFSARGSLVVGGPDVRKKARALETAFRERLGADCEAAGVPFPLELRVDLAGADAAQRGLADASRLDPSEGLVRFAAWSPAREPLQVFRKLLPSFILSGPAGLAVTGGAPAISEVVGYWPALVPRDRVVATVSVIRMAAGGTEQLVAEERVPFEGPTSPAPGNRPPRADRLPAPDSSGSGPIVEAPLGAVAHARSGDKGDAANIGIIGRSAACYEWLREHLSGPVVAGVGAGGDRRARHALRGTGPLGAQLHSGAGARRRRNPQPAARSAGEDTRPGPPPPAGAGSGRPPFHHHPRKSPPLRSVRCPLAGTMSSSHLQLDFEADGVVRLTLRRPEARNALTPEMVAGIPARLAELSALPAEECRVVVLQGEGRVFCAGADLKAMRASGRASEEENRRDARRFATLFRSVAAFPAPVIAAVQGAALGGGFGLAVCADHVVAEEAARFGTPEARLGLVPAVISPYVVRRLGPGRAGPFLLGGAVAKGQAALAAGIVHELTPVGGLLDVLGVTLARFLESAPRGGAPGEGAHAAGGSVAPAGHRGTDHSHDRRRPGLRRRAGGHGRLFHQIAAAVGPRVKVLGWRDPLTVLRVLCAAAAADRQPGRDRAADPPLGAGGAATRWRWSRLPPTAGRRCGRRLTRSSKFRTFWTGRP